MLGVKLLSLNVFFISVRAKSKQQNGRSLRGSPYNIHKLLNSIRFSFLQSFYHFNGYLTVQSRLGKTTQNRQYSLLQTALLIRVPTLLS